MDPRLALNSAAGQLGSTYRPESIRDRLCRSRREHLEQLEKIESALALLDDNPQLEKLHDTLNAIR